MCEAALQGLGRSGATRSYSVRVTPLLRKHASGSLSERRRQHARVQRRSIITGLVLALLLGAAPCNPAAVDVGAAGGDACARAWMDRSLRMNDIAVVGRTDRSGDYHPCYQRRVRFNVSLRDVEQR